MMTIESLSELVLSVRRLAAAAGASAKAQGDLERLGVALEPFRQTPIDQFALLVSATREYQATGILPDQMVSKQTKKPATKAPKIDVAEAVPRYIGELETLYAVVHEETTGRGAIDDLVAEIGKLPVDAIKKIAEGFNLRISKPTKAKALDEIRRKLDQRKASAERSEPILKGWS